MRDVRAGTASFGTFSTAVYYLLADLAEAFTDRYPGVRLRIVGLNSSAVADDVRAGRLEAGLVVLPVDAEGLVVRPALRDEVLYVSSQEHRVRRAVSARELARRPLILTDASHAAEDPTRLQLAARAQEAGVTIEPIVEVEYLSAALELAARGVGDVLVPSVVTKNRRFPPGLHSVRFAERIYDTFAFVTRRGATLSPATAALLELAEGLLRELGDELPGEITHPHGAFVLHYVEETTGMGKNERMRRLYANHLGREERVLASVRGTVEAGRNSPWTGLLLATDRRLVFIADDSARPISPTPRSSASSAARA